MRIIAGILSAGLIAGIATAAQAADGLYVGAETGVSITPSLKFKDGSAESTKSCTLVWFCAAYSGKRHNDYFLIT